MIKLQRKIKHNEKVCRAHDLGSYAQGQGRDQVRGQNRVSAITQKSTEVNNEKLCRAQRLGFYAHGQGHNQVKGQIVPKIVLLINY